MAGWASRWTAPNGFKAGTFDEERAKWCSDVGQPKDQHFAGWRHVMLHAQSFGAPDEALRDIAMSTAQTQFVAVPMEMKPGETTEQAVDRLHPTAAETPPTWDAVNLLIQEFNERYMVVREGGKVLIFIPVYDRLMKRNRYDRMSFEDLRKLCLNRSVNVPQKGGKNGYDRAAAADVWLTSPRRHQYPMGWCSTRPQPRPRVACSISGRASP